MPAIGAPRAFEFGVVTSVADALPHTIGRVEPRPPSESHAILVRWMGPQDANNAGFVHGGLVMKMCDEAGGIAAVKHSRCRVVTAAMDRMTFLEPVHLGNLVTCRASVNATWRTSMEVGIRVEAENPRTGEIRHTSTAYLTFVALDDDGRPTEVPPLAVESKREERRQREAQMRRTNRLAERDEIVGERDARGETQLGGVPGPSPSSGDV
jgi:acyl-CoA hydrolase